MTSLGLHLVNLPVDVRLGKMLIYACIFNCLDPMLTIAASLGAKSPLQYPSNQKEDAARAHSKFCLNNHPTYSVPVRPHSAQWTKNPYFPFSDHLAMIRIFDRWSHIFANEGKLAAINFCREHFLSFSVLEEIREIREQFRTYLIHSGLSHSSILSPRFYSEDLIRCALCAGALFLNLDNESQDCFPE